MNDYDVRIIRCYHDGITLAKLPMDKDPRGPKEIHALRRAHAAHAWKNRPPTPEIPRNVLRFGRAHT